MALPIRWSPRAANQLEAICNHIEQHSPRYAAVFAQRVMRTIKSIPANPRLGRVVPEYRDASLRERIYQGYRVVYRLTDDAVEVVAICHGARPIQNALEEEDD